MHNLVIAEICRCLADSGMAALRFNFRGTGASQGSHEEGIGERADVEGALSYLGSQEAVDSDRLGIAGYSFGAFVGLAAGVEDERAKALCGIAPPMTMVDWSFLKGSARPKLFVFGSRDDICPLAPFLELYRQLPGDNRYHVVQGADHSLFGHEEEVGQTVSAYFAEILLTKQSGRTGPSAPT